jgi:hypothetical protein
MCRFTKMFDENTTCLYLSCIAMRWLAVRIDTLAGDVHRLQHKSKEINIFISPYRVNKRRDSSISIATDYRLDDPMIGVQILVGAGNLSLQCRVETGPGAHPASCPVGTRGFLCGGKAAGA